MNESRPRFLTKHKTAILVLMLSLPIVLCGGLVAWWFGRQAAAHEQVEKMRADIRARGLPLDNMSMMEFRARTMSHEKTARWTTVLRRIESEEFVKSRTDIPVLGLGMEPPDVQPGKPYPESDKVRELLDRWSDLRRELHDITEGSGAIWTDIDVHGHSTLLPLPQSTRSVARLLELEHRDAIARDDRDQAYHSLLALIGTARSLELEPFWIVQVIHTAMLERLLDRLKQSVALDLLDDNQLRKILSQLKPLDDFSIGYRLTITGERAIVQPMYDDLKDYGDYDVPALSEIGNRRIDALTSLLWAAEAELVDTTDLTTFFIESAAFNDQLNASFKNASRLRQMDTALTSVLVPDMQSYSERIVRTAMMLRIAKLAIGLRLFEHQNGTWPDSLGRLTVDQIGVDLGPITPIGAKPFGYRVKGDEIELWGFVPTQPTDETPNAPVDPKSMPEENQKSWSYFDWSLAREPS